MVSPYYRSKEYRHLESKSLVPWPERHFLKEGKNHASASHLELLSRQDALRLQLFYREIDMPLCLLPTEMRDMRQVVKLVQCGCAVDVCLVSTLVRVVAQYFVHVVSALALTEASQLQLEELE